MFDVDLRRIVGVFIRSSQAKNNKERFFWVQEIAT